MTESRSFSDSLQQLRSSQKSSKGAPLYSLVVNRPLGRVFAALAHRAGLTPNHVTGISALFTFGGIALLAAGEPSWLVGVLVTVLLAIGYALDASDGQLARLRGGGSMFGEWLDHMIDSLKIASLHLAVAILAYRTFDVDEWWLLVPLAFSAVGVVHFVGMLLTELLGRVQAARTGVTTPVGDYSRLNSIVKLPTDYGVLCLVFVLLGAPELFRVVYTVLAASTIGYTVLVVGRWAGRLQALDAAASPTR